MAKRKLKTSDYLLIGLGIIVMLGTFIFLAAPKWMFTKGTMPSEQEALTMKNQVITFYTQKENRIAFPEEIKKFNPVSVAVDDNGVLVIFLTDSYQQYGYYFCREDLDPPESRKDHCVKKLTQGVYYYHHAW